MIESLVQLGWIQMWQTSLLFVIVLLVSLSFRKKRPHLVLLLWVVLLIKCVVPPLVTSPLGLFAAATPASQSEPISNSQLPKTPDSEPQTKATSSPESVEKSVSSPAQVFRPVSKANLLFAIWAAGFCLFVVITLGYTFSIRVRISRQSTPVDDEVNHLFQSMAREVGMAPQRIRLCATQSGLGPLVFGFLRPTIVLPEDLLKGSPAGSLKTVLAHELCHVRRRDHLLSILQLSAQAIFWFNPLVWFANRQVNRLCEVCCDDDTVGLFRFKSTTYARGLLEILDNQRAFQPVWMAPGIRPVEITKQRIKSILAHRGGHPFRKGHVAATLALLVVTIPAAGNSDWAVRLDSFLPDNLGAKTSRPTEDFISMLKEKHADVVGEPRTQMDIFLGDWDVTNSEGKLTGQSRIAYEKSGKMIRDEWTASDGSSAQGMSYFDPRNEEWRMTWVDSQGTIVESRGVWNGEAMFFEGQATSKDGQPFTYRSTMKPINQDQFQSVSSWSIDEKKTWTKGPISIYSRR